MSPRTADSNPDSDSVRLLQNFHLILDSIDEGIQVVDRNGVTVFYNRAAANLDNLKPEEVVGRHVLEVFPSLCRETSTLLQVLKAGQPVSNREQTFMNYKGDTITTVNSTLPVTVGGRLIGAVEVSRDITLIQEMAHRIVDLQMELFAKREGRRDIGSDRAHYTFEDIIGESECMLDLKRKAARAAGSISAVLVHGETGTGKELFVQAIHNAGHRGAGPFIAQNCAAFPEGLLEGILFGTTKGGFTGAYDRPGLFELADPGTIFLDEIDSMPSSLQGKLLRVLSEKRLRRVGDIKERMVDVRVVAAMTRLPEEAVAMGLLRNDLYYRLNVICLRIPPLRDRREDIPLLIDHFVGKFNSQLMMNVKGVSDEVFQLFLSYDWPGNVRELEHAIEGAMHMLDGDMILREHLPDHIGKSRLRPVDVPTPLDDIIQKMESGSDFRETVRDLENTLIRRAFTKAEGNVSQTARILGIPRQTLQYRLRRLGMQEEN
ncbi:MAG: sigma 54-interacting transcriptional regulator [Firmicutes bacterium]|nr:sigma 54-interacting transcriptional regulator [Bacillota bacterium]